MKNRKFLFAMVAGLAALTFTSCMDDPEPAPLDFITDAFIQKKVEDGVEKYAIGFWVFANKDLESATVEGPGEATWELEQENEGSKNVFSLYPEEEHYANTVPAAGDYKFTVTSTQEGEAPASVTDKVENKVLPAVVIDSIRFSSSRHVVKWTAVQNADEYIVRMYDETDKLVFRGPEQLGNKTEFSFGSTDQGWASNITPQNGKTYRLELLAILYESTSNTSNKRFNLQCISIGTAELVWGE